MNYSEHHRQAIEARILMMMLIKVSARSTEHFLETNQCNVTALQLGVLRALSHKQLTLSELSKNFTLDPSTLVPVVDALEGKGYVQRQRDPHDRRRVPLMLTDEGSALLYDAMRAMDVDPVVAAIEGMGAEQRDVFLETLRAIMTQVPDGVSMMAEMQERILHHIHVQNTPKG
jgi:DNA-binding MarR family transcriptional regulator